MLITHYRNQASTTNKMLTIGREGKWQGFETETQEVLITYRKGGKGEGFRKRDSGSLELYRECLLPTKETRQEPQTKYGVLITHYRD